MTDINDLHHLTGLMVDRAHERGDYPRPPSETKASRQMLEAALLARENSPSDP